MNGWIILFPWSLSVQEQTVAGVQGGCQPVTWFLPHPHSSQAPPSDHRSCPGLTQPIWSGQLGMPPVNTLRPMFVKTVSTLRRPTDQGTRWVGFPEWSGWFGVGSLKWAGAWLGHSLAFEPRHAFLLGGASAFPAVQ